MVESRSRAKGARAVAALVVLLGLAAPQAGEASDFAAAFERLKSLVGTWTIESASLRGEPYDDPRTVVYSLTGNGSALVESFRGEPAMTSVYHMDLEDLRLTHYCSAGNQPRMRAARWDAERSTLSFGFVDVTDLAAPGAYHTRELEVVFETEDRVRIRFEGLRDGAAVPVEMTLERRRDLAEAFTRLVGLAGTWDVEGAEGKSVVYEVTGDGSAVMETFLGGRGMASVYHMDGSSLMMTHYCSAGNQPRMRVTAWDRTAGVLRFELIDVTNVPDPSDYYTRELEIRFRDADHVELRFNGLRGGEEFPVTHALTRRLPGR